jgi:type IV secretory pathway VirB6-like protein
VQTYLASANTGTATAAATPGGSFSTMPDGVAQANGFPTSGTGSTIIPTATAQPQIAVNATPGTLDLPYSWFYNVIITAFQQPFSSLLASMQLMVSSVLIPLLTLALMALSLRFLIARYVSIDQFSKFLIDMAFVIPFVAAGSYWYQTYVVNPVLGLPTFFQQYTAQAGGSINLTTPASGFDAAYVGFFHAAEQVWHESTGFWHSLWVAVVVTVALWFIIGAITEMFGAFLVATVLSFLVLLVGPLAIPCVLFQTTRKLFFGWVWVGATIILSLLAVELVLGLYMGVIHQMLMASQMSGTPDTDVPAFCGAAAGMVLLGVCMYFVKPMVEAIGGAVAVGVDRAGYYATGQHVWTTAKVGARAAGAAVGG